MKHYKIKFFEKKNGQKERELDNLESYAFSNKDAYKVGRARLARMAKSYINTYDGADDDSRIVDARENFKSLQNGSINAYYEDVSSYFFKVFSKKIKRG